jgi:hypothetical protein
VQTKAFAGFTGYFQKTGWTIFRRSLAGGVPKRYRNHGAQRLFPLPEKISFWPTRSKNRFLPAAPEKGYASLFLKGTLT